MSWLAGNGAIGTALESGSKSSMGDAVKPAANNTANSSASPSFTLSNFAKDAGRDALNSVAGNYVEGFNNLRSGNIYEGAKQIFRGGPATQPSFLDKYRRRY